MRTQTRFRSHLLAPLTDASNQIENGREIADWLCANLPTDMQADSFPEDWGHRIIFGDPQLKDKVSVCCGYVGANQWSCFCDPYRSFFDKLFRRPLPRTEMRRVILAIDALLARSSEFFDVEWFENDARLREFNHGPRALSEAGD